MQEIKLNVNQSKGYEGVVLPQVTTNEEGKKLVSGRELHEALEIKTRFNDWVKRIIDYGFIENVDYTMLTQKRVTNNSKNPYTLETNCIMTLDMAKHVAMIQRSEIGMKIRNYFIECEKELHQPINQKERLLLQLFSDDKIEVANAHKQLLELETKPLKNEIKELKPKAEGYNYFLNDEGTLTVSMVCKQLGLQRSKVFAELRKQGYVFKNRTEATVKGIEKGYFKQVVKNGYPTMVVTPKGADFIKVTFKDSPLIENGIKRLKGYVNC